MGVYVRVAGLAVAFLAAVAHGLDSADVWTLTPGEKVITVFAASGVALVQGGVGLTRRLTAEAELRRERQIAEILRGLLVQVVQTSALDWTDVGVNAFLVEKRGRWPFAEPELRRRGGRQRMSSTPPPSNIRWTEGKGVIGLCWASAQDVEVDLNVVYGTVTDEAAWNALPDEERLGMTYGEFRATRHHGAVVATPILDRDGAVIGVISADAPAPGFAALAVPAVREHLGAAAVSIRNLLE